MKTLTLKIKIRKLEKPSACGVAYAIDGDISEHGVNSGFGSPYTQEEWDKINIEEELEKQRLSYQRQEKDFKVVLKIVEDFRQAQTTLFGSQLKADIPAQIPSQIPSQLPSQVGDDSFEEETDEEEEDFEQEQRDDDDQQEQESEQARVSLVCPNQNGQSVFKKGTEKEEKLVVHFHPPIENLRYWCVSVEPQNNCAGCLGSAGCFLGKENLIQHTIDWVKEQVLEENPLAKVIVEWDYNGFPLAGKTDKEMSDWVIAFKEKVEKQEEEEKEFATQIFQKHYDNFLRELEENDIKVYSVTLPHKKCPVYVHT